MYDELCGAAVSAAAQATRQALYSLIRLPQYREINTMDVFADAAFPPEVLGEILIRAGAWSPAGNHAVEEMQDGAAPDNAHHIADGDAAVAAAPPAAIAHAARPQICGWSVCRDWRNCLRRGPPPDHLARLLLEVHGPDEALMRALRCTNSAVDRCDLIREVLRLPGVRADCQDGAALFWASARGCEVVVRLLLGWEEHAPRADCQGGWALVSAAGRGHEVVVRLLLGWEEHAPRADCRDSEALISAAYGGYEAIVRLLLGWGKHAPRADCCDGMALDMAAAGGHEEVVRLLLGWKEHAPRADSQGGRPLTMAIAGGHEQVVRCLQEAINILPAVPVL